MFSHGDRNVSHNILEKDDKLLLNSSFFFSLQNEEKTIF